MQCDNNCCLTLSNLRDVCVSDTFFTIKSKKNTPFSKIRLGTPSTAISCTRNVFRRGWCHVPRPMELNYCQDRTSTRIKSTSPPCCFTNHFPKIHCAPKYLMYGIPKYTLQTLQKHLIHSAIWDTTFVQLKNNHLLAVRIDLLHNSARIETTLTVLVQLHEPVKTQNVRSCRQV